MGWRRKEQRTGLSFRDTFTGAGIEMASEGMLSKLWKGLCTEEEAWRPAGTLCSYNKHFSTSGELYAVGDWLSHKLTPKQVEDWHKCYGQDQEDEVVDNRGWNNVRLHREFCKEPECEICLAWVNGADSLDEAIHHVLNDDDSQCPHCGITLPLCACVQEAMAKEESGFPIGREPTPSWVSAALLVTGLTLDRAGTLRQRIIFSQEGWPCIKCRQETKCQHPHIVKRGGEDMDSYVCGDCDQLLIGDPLPNEQRCDQCGVSIQKDSGSGEGNRHGRGDDEDE